jgi:hypothetical protein
MPGQLRIPQTGRIPPKSQLEADGAFKRREIHGMPGRSRVYQFSGPRANKSAKIVRE